MASTSNFEAKVLMAKGKRATAAYVYADCSNNPCPQHLNDVLNSLLNPAKAIDEWETIDWCKWLMAGGRTPDDYATTGKPRHPLWSRTRTSKQTTLNGPRSLLWNPSHPHRL
jgi:hypothetical protein